MHSKREKGPTYQHENVDVHAPFASPSPGSCGSWVWSVTGKAKSLLVQREASTLNTLLFIYLIL